MAFTAEPDFPLTEDSKPQPNVPKGTMLKDSYLAKDGSVFPGTEREYQIYLPAGFDKAKPAAFMVFQDGVIYQTPVVFDNLIAKQDIPPLVGIFIKPGVVPAANDKALPRFNRSFEYDSITPTYSQFLLDEFLPAIMTKHGIQLSTDPNQAAISGNSSGGICAFMVAWHRPDRFRRVFTGVGTYVGIHGADQLAVLVRKFEPKPLRVFLQSGTGDNNLYCGDWWMANQTMERSLSWAGYDVSHAWGEGGHNAKHASQIFPDVLRWLWRDWKTDMEIKANAKSESKWKGYEVVGEGELRSLQMPVDSKLEGHGSDFHRLAAAKDGAVFVIAENSSSLWTVSATGNATIMANRVLNSHIQFDLGINAEGQPVALFAGPEGFRYLKALNTDDKKRRPQRFSGVSSFVMRSDGKTLVSVEDNFAEGDPFSPHKGAGIFILPEKEEPGGAGSFVHADSVRAFEKLCLSPDQTVIYASQKESGVIFSAQVIDVEAPSGGDSFAAKPDTAGVPAIHALEPFGDLEEIRGQQLKVGGLCVDTNGWLYVATLLGIQVLDQAGRVNFIIPTPKPPQDVCFGGKDLGELFIACGDAIYKRKTTAHGIVSGQMAPMTPPKPKL
ncbi:alpha/beta hydrolase-fold protein [Prosthecobacter sp.]|uniref:alpha/beta hydrolase-fold protein n=1 Tax=Prosthecobacter sp. TaxID=1965333 RepID=UPI0024882E15|nr:alpha/beta hydrolase-fold protein [Prosthecobacter sp.]MDI1312323.1 alpha/beta hydrolase-fold protein [Prosthecobacter sp.]